MKFSRHRLFRAGTAYALLLLLAGVLLAATGAYFQYQQIEKGARVEFERLSSRTEVEISTRMENAVHALRGARGLYAASNDGVGRATFRRFVLSRDMEKEFPGVRGLGFIQRVERTDLAAFQAAQQADGAPEFALHQLIDKHLADLFVVTLIEPAANNPGVPGLDVGSEAIRRAGIQQAINIGAPTVTGTINLVQDSKKMPGLLLYVPVYRNGAPIDLPMERRAALVGVLFAPIVMAEILEGMPDVASGMLDFEVVDAPINATSGTLMFDAVPSVGLRASATGLGPPPRYTLRKPLQLPGRSVTLSMNSTPAFEKSIQLTFPWLIFAGGTLISLLLAMLLRQQVSGRLRAEKLARAMTHDLQMALRENEALLSTLNSHSIVSIADRDGRIIQVNDAFCQISGYSRAELLGQDHRIVKSNVQTPQFWVDMWATIASGKPWRGQVCNQGKQGHLYWIDTLIAPFISSDGNIEKYIAIRTDITATKKAEEELRWSQSLLDKMSNASPLAFLVVDNRTDDILYFNQRLCAIWGLAHLAERLRRKELKNQDLTPYCQGLLADAPSYLESCKPLQSEHNRITLEDEIAFVDGRTVRRVTTQIRDIDDQYFGRFYIFEDITERKNAERALTDATRAAQAASLSKSQFLANMSHELRTPMNAILGMLALLRKTDLSTRQADYAAKSQGAARALLSLLNEILDFSKIEAGKMELDPHPFAIDQMLRDLSVILSANVGERPVEVLFDIDPLLPRHLVGDVMRLQQVLLNLGSNAIKFTTQGEVVLSIELIGRTEDVATLQFCLRDSGIGIAPENQARIFSGFTQAESSTTRRFGGTGLGLAISQRFVALMGGEMELQSELGQGSRFFFTLTLPIAAASEPPAHPPVLPSEGPASWRVLVIDDNATAREVMQQMGQSLGWQVELVESGAQALDLFQQRAQQGIAFQAIFVDWGMPGMDGWQTSHALRAMAAEQAKAGAPGIAPVVVMVTAHGREMLSQRSRSEQVLLDGFLVKPVTASMLLDAVLNARNDPQHSPQSVPAAALPAQHSLQGMRLLLVEDNLNNQQVASELLEGEGALVQIANHGQEAVEAIAAANPMFDLVLMDLQMPVMDGFAATRVIRHDLGLRTLPIVAMTANAMAADREACLAAGMNDHVGKPFDINDLILVLRSLTLWGNTVPTAFAQVPVLSPALAQVAAAVGVDLGAALHRLGDKPEIYRRTLASFVKDVQAMPGQLQGLAQQTDAAASRAEVQRVLHTLKGLAATLGAVALSAQAAAAEKTMAKSPDSHPLEAVIQQACGDIDKALPGLQTLLQALQDDQARTAEAFEPRSSTPAAGPALVQALVSALQAMVQLLEDGDMDAMHAMAELQQQFGQALGERVAPLEEAMADLNFEQALPLCQELLAHYTAAAVAGA